MRFLTFLAVSLFLSPGFAQNLSPAADQQLTREIYKELIEINTSFSTGATTPAAEAMAARLRAAGFPASDIQVVGAAPHKMNLVVRYRGTGAKRPLLLLAHLDVVEAKRSDWTFDPFVLHEQDGFFYGRGTSDDKAQAAIWIANLIRYRREGFRPSRDLIVALTADEEGGGPYNGAVWLLGHRRELIDAEFALNEGGGGEMHDSRRLLNLLQVAEKTYADYRIEARNPGGHSAMPVKENAIYRLAAALERISRYEFPIRLNEVTRAYFEATASLYTGALAEDFQAVARGGQQAITRVAAASPAWNAVLRTTCVATMLDGGHALNALPQTAGANINCRVHPDDSPQFVLDTLKKVIADDKVSVRPSGEPPASAPASPLRDDILSAAKRVTSQMWPGVPVVPCLGTGATDGRFLRAAGIPTYGMTGLFMERDDMRAHGQNERVGVAQFYESATYLYRLVRELAQ